MNLVLDLCCGMGGWSYPFVARGFRVLGVDVVQHPSFAGEFLCSDIRSLNGGAFGRVGLVLASPPCSEFSLWDKPFLNSKNWKKVTPLLPPDLSVVHACMRIAIEARAPLILENVRGAQRFIGTARAHFDSFYLWGDGVPALLPLANRERWKERYSSDRKDLRARIPPILSEYIFTVYKGSVNG